MYNLNCKQQKERSTMKAIQISSQWYVVREDSNTKRGFVILSGPYPEEWQAVSQTRLNDV